MRLLSFFRNGFYWLIGIGCLCSLLMWFLYLSVAKEFFSRQLSQELGGEVVVAEFTKQWRGRVIDITAQDVSVRFDGVEYKAHIRVLYGRLDAWRSVLNLSPRFQEIKAEGVTITLPKEGYFSSGEETAGFSQELTSGSFQTRFLENTSISSESLNKAFVFFASRVERLILTDGIIEDNNKTPIGILPDIDWIAAQPLRSAVLLEKHKRSVLPPSLVLPDQFSWSEQHLFTVKFSGVDMAVLPYFFDIFPDRWQLLGTTDITLLCSLSRGGLVKCTGSTADGIISVNQGTRSLFRFGAIHADFYSRNEYGWSALLTFVPLPLETGEKRVTNSRVTLHQFLTKDKKEIIAGTISPFTLSPITSWINSNLHGWSMLDATSDNTTFFLTRTDEQNNEPKAERSALLPAAWRWRVLSDFHSAEFHTVKKIAIRDVSGRLDISEAHASVVFNHGASSSFIISEEAGKKIAMPFVVTGGVIFSRDLSGKTNLLLQDICVTSGALGVDASGALVQSVTSEGSAWMAENLHVTLHPGLLADYFSLPWWRRSNPKTLHAIASHAARVERANFTSNGLLGDTFTDFLSEAALTIRWRDFPVVNDDVIATLHIERGMMNFDASLENSGQRLTVRDVPITLLNSKNTRISLHGSADLEFSQLLQYSRQWFFSDLKPRQQQWFPSKVTGSSVINWQFLWQQDTGIAEITWTGDIHHGYTRLLNKAFVPVKVTGRHRVFSLYREITKRSSVFEALAGLPRSWAEGHVALFGKSSADSLIGLIGGKEGSGLADLLASGVDGRTTVTVDFSYNSKRLLQLDFRSNLKGISSNLPLPLTKASDEEWPFLLTLLNKKIGEVYQIGFLGVSTEISNLVSHKEGSVLPLQMILRGDVNVLDVSQWLVLGGQHALSERDVTLDIDVTTQALLFDSYQFDDVGILMSHKNDSNASLTLHGDQLSGTVFFPDSLCPLRLQFSHLLLNPNGNRASDTKPWNSIPELILTADRLVYRGNDMGNVELLHQTDPDDATSSRFDLRLIDHEFEATAEAEWHLDQEKTELNATIHADRFSALNKKMPSSSNATEDGVTDISLRLSWPDLPWRLDVTNLEGNVGLSIDNVRFLDIDSKIANWLEAFSLQKLARRLTMDFGDIYGGGSSFERIRGSMRIVDGIGTIDHFAMHGRAYNVAIEGTINLVDEIYDQVAIVTPKYTKFLRLPFSAVFGPVGLTGSALSYLSEWVVGRDLLGLSSLEGNVDQIFSSRYRISGPWSTPEVNHIE